MVALRDSAKQWSVVLPSTGNTTDSSENRGELERISLAAKRAIWNTARKVPGRGMDRDDNTKELYSAFVSSIRLFNEDRKFHNLPSPEFTKYLQVADQAFGRIPDECAESGHDVPPEDVIQEARRIVRGMLRRIPCEYDVYPMDERSVAVEVDGGLGRRTLLVCEDGGSAVCIVTVNRKSRRARYEDSSILPDGFVFDALRDMGHKGVQGIFYI